MSKEWYAVCKDCREKYGYSDDSNSLSMQRGMSRPERCPKCRKLHSREISTLGLSHYNMVPVTPVPSTGLMPGRLGKLNRPDRVHELIENKPQFDIKKFGIKDVHIEEYFNLMLEKQVTVIVAPTGAGKSTFLPYRLMVPPKSFPNDLFTSNGQIIITQPRIQPTKKIPLFVARDLHGSNLGAGFDVGFRHSGNPSTDWRNKLVYMTDGTLINMIIRNELGKLSVIMIDEAHERSLNIDLILGLLKQQLARYPNLKLIIASATINAGMFLEFYGGPKNFNPDDYSRASEQGYPTYNNKKIYKELKNSPVGFYGFPGVRQYDVEERYYEGELIPEKQWAGRMPEEMGKKILDLLHDVIQTKKEPWGDILGFLHGEKPIEKTVELIKSGVEEDHALAGKVQVLPLYTKLPPAKQDLALLPKKNPKQIKVVISTNVAETSLTVDGVVHVVDSGLINESQWDSSTQTSFVVPKIHSQAGCKQRWGRAGRIQPGIAHCLYTKEQFKKFDPYTSPEILRAPLDQVVLTAKAAGVDNVHDFDWIQRPSKEELDRAPRFLQKIGAVDEQGDLTAHGLELRNFGEEIDIANLMILADRFGCAVEMATILPMRRLGNYTSCLVWDKGWDAASKRAVHKIHKGFVVPCLDDLEFSLKLWAAWENAKKRNKVLEWSKNYFINIQILENEIAEERENLLSGLTGHKKEQKLRPIDFDLLNKVRILMAYGLPNQIYLLHEARANLQETVQTPIYHPYLPETDKKEELELLHSNAQIEISPGSICLDRALEAFVCGKRLRTRRRMSPLEEPQTIITAAFLVLIQPKWLQYLNLPVISLARAIANETRLPSGELIKANDPFRLFIDQYYPVGTTFNCVKTSVADLVGLQNIAAPAPQLHPRRNNEDVDAPMDVENLEAESNKLRTTGIRKEDQKYIVEEEGEDNKDPLNWFEEIGTNLDEDYPKGDLQRLQSPPKPSMQVKGKIVYSPPGTVDAMEFRAIVIGFDLTDPGQPLILMERPSVPSSFKKFVDKYKVGEKIHARITAKEQYANDRLVYLIAREKETEHELILDPLDTSLGGRNFAVNQMSIGQPIEGTIEGIDPVGQRVRVTSLQEAEADLLKFIGRGEERTLDARIVEVRDNGLHVWIDPSNENIKIPISAFVYIDRLPQRPDEMWLGNDCKVKINPKPKKHGYRRGLGNLPDEEINLLRKKFSWGPKIELDDENRSIIIQGRLTYHQRMKLLSLSNNSDFQLAVNILFRRSNELDTRIIDMTGANNLSNDLKENNTQKMTITRILDGTVIVKNKEGFEMPIPRRESDFDRNIDLKEKFEVGRSVKVYIKKVDVTAGDVVGSLNNPARDPLKRYKINQIVSGKVDRWANDGSGIFIRIASGVEGYVHKDQITFEPLKDIEATYKQGQRVSARITELDFENRNMRLSIYGLYFRTLVVPPDYIGMVIGKDWATKSGIESASRAKINISQDGICEITGPDRAIIKKAANSIEAILATCTARFQLDDLQIRMLIGRGGENIKGIQKATDSQITVDRNGAVKIVSPNRETFAKCLKRVEKSIKYYKATIRIPPARMGFVIGKGGTTIQRIQRESNVRIDMSRDGSGLIYLEGLSEPNARQAIEIIRPLASDLEVVSTAEGKIPGKKSMSLLIPHQRAITKKAARTIKPLTKLRPNTSQKSEPTTSRKKNNITAAKTKSLKNKGQSKTSKKVLASKKAVSKTKARKSSK